MKEAEDELQMNLEDMYINMSEETFKEMRRVMPVSWACLDTNEMQRVLNSYILSYVVTQTKMEWSLHAHRTAKDLGRST